MQGLFTVYPCLLQLCFITEPWTAVSNILVSNLQVFSLTSSNYTCLVSFQFFFQTPTTVLCNSFSSIIQYLDKFCHILIPSFFFFHQLHEIMALLSRALKYRCQLSRETILSCSQCCVQSRTFVPPTGREYGLEKKWAYYNQPAIDTYAAKVNY